MGGKKYTPLEFLKYIREPLAQSEIDRWIKINGITIEMSSLLFDFISSLYCLVNETYLGEDYVVTNDDRDKHFDWCWSKVINNFEKESIYFKNSTTSFGFCISYRLNKKSTLLQFLPK